ncbi:hypothetical protein ACQ4PT_002126 [Festuca glaucescens]
MALSDLHDDLLRRILYFTPAKEAASTSALARRWRSLWLSSGAVNLDSFSNSSGGHSLDERSYKGVAVRNAFLRGAEAALAASRAPIRRLSFRLEGQTNKYVRQPDSIYKVLDAVLSNPAARRVDELRVTVSHGSQSPVCLPIVSIGSRPLDSLRVMDISTCHCQAHTPAELALRRLEAMRLHRCTVPAKDLQAMMDAAPHLTTLQLYEVQLVGTCKRIRCPRVTTLVLADLDWRESSSWRGGMDLDAPMLRSFRYRGFLRRFSLEPPATTEIAHVDLHFVGDNEHRQRDDETCRLFWRFVKNFRNVKTMKLRLVHLEHIVVADKRKTAKLYTLAADTLFSNLHRLDLQAFYTPGRRAGGVAFATFLHCCPMIRVLVLELSTVDGDPSKSASHVQDFSDEKGKLEFCKSVDQFICPQSKPAISLDGEHDEENGS